jgi:hypothetical protein
MEWTNARVNIGVPRQFLEKQTAICHGMWHGISQTRQSLKNAVLRGYVFWGAERKGLGMVFFIKLRECNRHADPDRRRAIRLHLTPALASSQRAAEPVAASLLCVR